MNKILTVAELEAKASSLSIGEINNTLRVGKVRIGHKRANGDMEESGWFTSFTSDHSEYVPGEKGRTYCYTKESALQEALHSAAWYRRYVAFEKLAA
ncbi:hypothetical protein [Mesorhizobium sp. A623]